MLPRNRFLEWLILGIATTLLAYDLPAETVFPRGEWEVRTPGECGIDGGALDEVSKALGGRGCVIKDGYVIKTWGDQAEQSDWFSSAKPVLSTMLFFAIQEGLVKDVDQRISDFGWNLKPKDRTMTFRHLGAMTSGYARPEAPGEAWAYNDFAIQLYQMTLFDKVFGGGDSVQVAEHPDRFGALGFQDGFQFNRKRRMRASVRDWARIVWFWMNKGRWQDRQVLERRFFDDYMTPQVPKDLPRTQKSDEDDYLEIGSYGGGSDQTYYGSGLYGFNWWFNDTGLNNPDRLMWPGAPPDTVMTLGARGNCSAMFPSLGLAVIGANADWGEEKPGDPKSQQNRVLKLAAQAAGYSTESFRITGDLRKWRPVTIDFHGPVANASDTNPNPFLDYRLQVRFVGPGGKEYDVPGFFAGDGLGGLRGEIWRVMFSPDEVGEWSFRASFRKGDQIAVSLDPNDGEPAVLEGTEGRFSVTPQDESSPGFYRWGRLEYVGGHYLKTHDGPYWLKGGSDSPEDFLAYRGFTNTPRAGHTYANHVADWREGDPDWGEGKGEGIIGALNYLASEHVNSIYFLPMNIGGDGKNVDPYLGPIDGKGNPDNDNLHFDLTKLYQWGIVFEHAQRNGILLHFVLNEAEEANKRELDDGQLGVERKVFYRELIARYGHLPALQWNISEEYNLGHNLGPDRVKAFAQYILDVDPYDHPITVHHSSRAEKVWTPFLGDSRFTVTSFQENENVSDLVERWREKSREAGAPLVIGMDEFFPDKTSPDNIDRHRKEYIWPIYFSGGQMEFILDDLLKTEDFRKYERLWRYMAIARLFIEEHLPFWEMEPADSLLTGAAEYRGENNLVSAQVFMKEGECYAIYLPSAESTGALDLTNVAGAFVARWFNPRSGRFEGQERRVKGGGNIPLGSPPADVQEDWVALLKSATSPWRETGPRTIFSVTDDETFDQLNSGKWRLSGALEVRFAGRIQPHEASSFAFFGPGVEAIEGRFGSVEIPEGWSCDVEYDHQAGSVTLSRFRPDRAPAFPEAEGFGKYTIGGRGGKVYEVTNLDDSGPGSFRAACEAEGPRTVVFLVSGTIALESKLKITNPYITIAGQTAPGDGICIKNYQVSFDTQHMVVRYMRFRPGDEIGIEQDALGGEGDHIIIDHCSVSWGTDETLSINKASNFTVQWCLVSESLFNSVHKKGNHGYGGLWGGPGGTFHHNILAHHSSRNPRASGNEDSGLLDFRNNVIYNWGFNSAYGGELWPRNWINNYYKPGPATRDSVRRRIYLQKDPRGKMYAVGNLMYGFPEVTADNWGKGIDFSEDGNASEATLRVDTEYCVAPVITQGAEDAYESVLQAAGASLKRDSIDTRIIEEIRTGTATFGESFDGGANGIIDSQDDVGGWPKLQSAPAPPDTDHDGMPDHWEDARGLNPRDPSDGPTDSDGDGYTNLEDYLNSLCPSLY